MRLAGQKNHYNVKLLKGYGVSINLLLTGEWVASTFQAKPVVPKID